MNKSPQPEDAVNYRTSLWESLAFFQAFRMKGDN